MHEPCSTPAIGDVAIHTFALTGGAAERAAWWAVLSPRERERAERFRHPDDRARFVVAHGRLRWILSAYGAGLPEGLELLEGQYGKPKLADSSLRFSLSHSGSVGLVAVAREREVGVDVERIRSRPELRAVARRFFTPAEAAALERLDPAEFIAAFYRCWTRKEAYVKGRGLGLRLALDGFEVGIERRVAAVTSWHLVDLDLRPGYAAALAVEKIRGDPSAAPGT